MAGPGIWPIWLCCESPCPATSVLRICPSCRSESSCCIDSGMKSATRYRALVYSACGKLLTYWMFCILWIWPVAVTIGAWRCHNLTHWFCLCSSLRYQTVVLVSNKIIRLLHFGLDVPVSQLHVQLTRMLRNICMKNDCWIQLNVKEGECWDFQYKKTKQLFKQKHFLFFSSRVDFKYL